ncbi:MAG: Rieske 2Fe-2S domain-containing protein, partial [Acidimicrobiia bacterium]|nr:Rieske 2Fe-2S domain-containing protein [Acidimicrobiia bacterium]
MAAELASMLVGEDGFLPKERYVSQAFLDLELERLWPRVWQIACREEQVAEPGDFVEYAIGDQSVLVVRTDGGELAAHHNACLHRGTRLATGAGRFTDSSIRCRYHAWRYD